jgi:hypothetical protein
LRLPSNNLLTVSDIGLDPTALTVTPTWPDGSNWPYHVTSDNGTVSANRVQVTITYAWLPEAFFGGVTFGSTSQMQITYWRSVGVRRIIVTLHQRRIDRRSGIVAVLVALMMVVLLGVVALAADGGLLLANRRNAQAAADTAALSGAADLLANWTTGGRLGGDDPDGTASNSAFAVAAANGYSNDGTTSIVTVNVFGSNYAGGPNAGKTIPLGYVEVIIQYNQPRIFSSVFGTAPIPVQARSVARSQWTFAPPIVVLDRSADGALFMGNGNGSVYVPNGAVFVNSSSSFAMQTSSAGTMMAPQYNVTGNATAGFNNYPASGNLRTGTNPIADPLAYIPAPDPASMTTQPQPTAVNGVYTLNPGRYVGGLRFTDNLNVVMNPGIYYMDGGGFTFNNNVPNNPASLTGSQVMIYNGGSNPGNLTIQGNGAVTLGPLLGSSYGLAQGLTIFQDRSATNPVKINHTGTGQDGAYSISGAIYAANAFVRVQRSGQDNPVGSQFISRTLYLNGTADATVPGKFVYQRMLGGVE